LDKQTNHSDIKTKAGIRQILMKEWEKGEARKRGSEKFMTDFTHRQKLSLCQPQ
jgi:siroheme synthase (precorrin-2 oxidase/ferrochelatase)